MTAMTSAVAMAGLSVISDPAVSSFSHMKTMTR